MKATKKTVEKSASIPVQKDEKEKKSPKDQIAIIGSKQDIPPESNVNKLPITYTFKNPVKDFNAILTLKS